MVKVGMVNNVGSGDGSANLIDEVKLKDAVMRIVKCIEESNKLTFTYRASDFEPTKISTVFQRVEEINGIIDRFLTLFADFEKAKHEIIAAYNRAKLLYEEQYHKAASAPDFLISKGYAYQERQSFYTLKVFDLKKYLLAYEDIVTETLPGVEGRLKRKLDFLRSVKYDYFGTINALKSGSVTMMEAGK